MDNKEWKDTMGKLSVDELSSEIAEQRKKIHYLSDLKAEKECEQFKWGGHYIRIYECSGASPKYMSCKWCKLDRSSLHKEPHIWFHGVGFRSDFGPHEDDNYVDFGTWDDTYINHRLWKEACEARARGKKYDGYKIEVITKEEYYKAFNLMLMYMKNSLYEFDTNQNGKETKIDE